MQNTLLRVEATAYWTNRFGEYLGRTENGFRVPMSACEPIIGFYPPDHTDFAECGHVVEVNGVLGLGIEWECADDEVPEPARVAHWRAIAPEGCLFDAYAGCDERPTWNDRWLFMAFIPADLLTHELVATCCSFMSAHI